MSLPSGTRLGVYELVAPIGAGGMGEVYRARDTQLKREVALKTLPSGVTGDVERLGRFQREAEVLAALNHTNIAQIHGLADGQVSGVAVRALVMELVEGDDLAQRIAASGAVALPEALAIARQVAMALDYAHERGIVHRDLKPANIKVTPDGHVKVLDFGLAKAMETGTGIGDQGSGDRANSPTLTSPAMTARGMILGTAAYMSPEQAKGKVVDKRSDIWAFGCVLFELITGKRTFDGEDVTDSIVAVMSRDPSWQALPATTPAAVRKLLRRCLEKDRTRRLADIRDALFEIEDAIAHPEGTAEAVSTAVATVTSGRTSGWWWALPGVAVGALGLLALQLTGLLPGASRPETPPLRVSILHPEGSEVGPPAISPDGTRVAYRARRADGMPLLFIRDLATGDVRALAGTDDPFSPFWSPDSKNLAFFAGTALKRVAADGGPVQVISAGAVGIGVAYGGSWGVGDTILFAPSDSSALRRVPAGGGLVQTVGSLEGPDWSHLFPSFLPDGQRFLYTASQYTVARESGARGVYLGSLNGGVPARILADATSAVFSPTGHLVFARSGEPMAIRFDAAQGRVIGEPFPLGGQVAVESTHHFAALSVAANGALALRPPPSTFWSTSALSTELRVLDRTGSIVAHAPVALYTHAMAVQPGGRAVAVQIIDERSATNDLYLVDIATGSRSPITMTRGWAGRPVWSADASRLAYANQPAGSLDDLHIKDLRSGRDTPVIQSASRVEQPSAWSHDGRQLLVFTFEANIGTRALQTFSVESKSLTPFATNVALQAAFSPDDRFVAFVSTESGQTEVVVTTFPDRKQTWPLTSNGGRVISWRADGREILVAAINGHIEAYPVSTEGGRFSADPPTIVVRDVGMQNVFSTATPDHSRIVIRVDPEAAKDRGEIRLLFNWASRLPGQSR